MSRVSRLPLRGARPPAEARAAPDGAAALPPPRRCDGCGADTRSAARHRGNNVQWLLGLHGTLDPDSLCGLPQTCSETSVSLMWDFGQIPPKCNFWSVEAGPRANHAVGSDTQASPRLPSPGSALPLNQQSIQILSWCPEARFTATCPHRLQATVPHISGLYGARNLRVGLRRGLSVRPVCGRGVAEVRDLTGPAARSLPGTRHSDPEEGTVKPVTRLTHCIVCRAFQTACDPLPTGAVCVLGSQSPVPLKQGMRMLLMNRTTCEAISIDLHAALYSFFALFLQP